MAKRRKGRRINGILLLDKPKGLTSNAALQQVKHLYRAQKAGHTGSLDPLAQGLLPICLGQATRLSAFLLDADKAYRVTVRLGQSTTTADAEGEIIEEGDWQSIQLTDVQAVLPRFQGEIEQLPPMYSAVKHQGKRLYQLAREGKVVARQPRRIHIYALELLHFEPPYLELDIQCSKGTYVRTLAEDIGKALGCGAHISALTRTQVGPYSSDQMHSLAELEQILEEGGLAGLDQLLLPLDSGLAQYPAVQLNPDSSFYIRQGQPVQVPKAPLQGWVRLYDAQGFIGVGEINDDGLVAPKRLFSL